MDKQFSHLILITGSHGQVGRELVDICRVRQINYIDYSSRQLDITNEASVRREIERHKPAAVINAAAYTAVDNAENDVERAYAVNRDGVKNLAIACEAVGATLVHISTDYVFDGEKKEPYNEMDIAHPIGVYGASKYAGEQAIKKFSSKYFIIRVSWVFGQYGANFVKTMLRLAEDRPDISVVDDQYGAPTSAAHIAEKLIELVTDNCSEYGTYHLESNPGISWYEFAKIIFQKARESGVIEKMPNVHPIKSSEYPTPVKRPKNSKLVSNCDFELGPVLWKEHLDKLF